MKGTIRLVEVGRPIVGLPVTDGVDSISKITEVGASRQVVFLDRYKSKIPISISDVKQLVMDIVTRRPITKHKSSTLVNQVPIYVGDWNTILENKLIDKEVDFQIHTETIGTNEFNFMEQDCAKIEKHTLTNEVEHTAK